MSDHEHLDEQDRLPRVDFSCPNLLRHWRIQFYGESLGCGGRHIQPKSPLAHVRLHVQPSGLQHHRQPRENL